MSAEPRNGPQRLVVWACLALAGCAGTRLPKQRPVEFSVRYDWSPGMTPEYEQIEITGNQGTYTNKPEDGTEQVTSFTVTNEELDALYAVFRDNEFDHIRTRTGSADDRGGASIYLTVGKRSYGISGSGQSFLVREDIDAWNRVVQALQKLAADKVAKPAP